MLEGEIGAGLYSILSSVCPILNYTT
jgi:hypothetical protein